MGTECRFPLFDCLKPSQQDDLATWYQKKFRRKFRPPGMQPLEIEPTSQIPRLMRETGKEIRL